MLLNCIVSDFEYDICSYNLLTEKVSKSVTYVPHAKCNKYRLSKYKKIFMFIVGDTQFKMQQSKGKLAYSRGDENFKYVIYKIRRNIVFNNKKGW